ncbi:MAG: hypothetical protein JST55_05705 [Bacteroidetes bacterium]|nr:hypothetical protein [Bacteroidota bacterium]
MFFTSQLFSQSQIKLLERAYKENSDSLMLIFINNWKKDLPANYIDETNQDSILSSAVEIYKLFYKKKKITEHPYGENDAKPAYSLNMQSNSLPELNLSLLPSDFFIRVKERIGYFQWTEDSTWNNYFPENERRDTLKPPEISYFMNGNELKLIKIKNFLPSYIVEKAKFLDSNYIGIFNYFLLGNFRKEQFTRFENNNLKRTEEEFQKRFSYLTNYLPIYFTGGHVIITDENGDDIFNRGEGMLIGDYDTISEIIFDKSLKYASVGVTNDMSSTTYYLERTDNGWKVKKKRSLYI